MVKAIGNMVANVPPKDKVSAKMQARFGSKSLGTHAGKGETVAKATNSAKPVVKYKKRKR